MANRVVSSDLWNDSKWVNITNIRTRYIWLYLLTCSHSHSCGVFTLPLRYASIDTGIEAEELKMYIRELQDNHLLIYDYKREEMAIFKYPIYNLRNINERIVKMVRNGLNQVKNKSLIKAVYISLCEIKDNDKKTEFQPLIDLYEQFLLEKGKENHLKKDKVKVKVKVESKGCLENKEKEIKDLDSSWEDLMKEIEN